MIGSDVMDRPRRPRGWGSGAVAHLVLAVVALILMGACLYAVRTFTVFASPTLFLAAIFLLVVFIGVLVYALLRALTLPGAMLRSLGASAWVGLESNQYVVRFRTTGSPWVRWLRNRLRLDTPTGLWLTATIVITAIPLGNFLNLAFAVAAHGALTQVDQRIANLMPTIRTDGETAFFASATMLANVETLVLVTAAAVIILWWKRERFLAGAVLATVLLQEGLYDAIKPIVGRARPDASLALLVNTGPSFPSGHVMRATVAYGIIAYVLFKTFRSRAARAATVAVYLLIALLVGLSRVYLGVHYATDVWGSMLLGAAVLAAVVGFLEIAARFPIVSGRRRPVAPGRLLAVVPALGIAFALVAAPFLVHPEDHPAPPRTQALPSLDTASLSRLPVYSETLTGDRMEPASFVFVGTEDELVHAFEGRGWDRADRSTLADTLRAVAVGFQGGQYRTAPVTPAFMASEPEAIAFQQATASNTLRQRHHIRIWRSSYTAPDGRAVWEATASFDDGIEFAGAAKIPTHHIDPNVDAERAYIIGSLGYPEHLVPLTTPQMGHNGSGDEFFTDGKAELVSLQ
ncbi:LssY C-terminal domain-containing protein [Sinomonas sp. ASV322]|uniref:LssY C-terminal domain-containing protein n=1 Tax=Sinomonas sp. ASV322 TaxID=3041920 RepID=UPI0027DD706B|nr:LssY C-terminal domain-containing protein [Sinomonas sp. ASV322]MDQ4501264.1 LssY C-terminal domain-containing protein [Sinomonas sp. ASV322]